MARQKLKPRADGRIPLHREGRYFYGKTEKEALQKYEQWRKDRDAGLLEESQGITVRTYAGRWLPLHKSGVSDKTYNSYANHINRLIQSLGDMPMHSVSIDDARGVYLTHYQDRSESSIKKARMLFIDLFDTAIENGLCRKNPFRSKKAQPDKGKDGTHRAITDYERSLILETEHPLRKAVMVMLYAGLRRGEALALDLDRDVDLKENTLTVNYAVRYDSNQPILADPKTEAGKRTITIFSILQKELKGCHGLLAPSASGKLMSEAAFDSAWNSFINTIECRINNVNQKRWYGRTREHKQRIAEAAKLREQGKEKEAAEIDLPPWKTFDVRPHDLRHSYCTMLRDAGVDMKQAMEWMGHADEKMILRIYDHVSSERTRKSASQVENLLASCQNSCQTELGARKTLGK